MKGFQPYLILSLLSLTTCVEPYDFPEFEPPRILVVDARLSDLNEAHRVVLSYTASGSPVPATGAEVFTRDNNGNAIYFNETTPGVYLADSVYRAYANRRYTLFIETADGKKYQSNEQDVVTSTDIDELYASFQILPSQESGGFESGLQIFVDTYDVSKPVSYYRFEWEDSWQIRMPYPSYFDYDTAFDQLIVRDVPLGYCYKFSNSKELIIGSTSGQINNRLDQFPIEFIKQWDNRIEWGYSILVRQYTLSEEAYRFYRLLKQTNESAGSFFDEQKGQVVGNIVPEDPDEIVLGYFEVSGVSEKRIYVDPTSFVDDGLILPYTRYCNVPPDEFVEVAVGDLGDYFRQPFSETTVIYNAVPPVGASYYVLPRSCSDCTYYGGVLEKPDYWP